MNSLLHTVNKSPFASTALADCLARAHHGAAILLIEDAVYAALAKGSFALTLAAAQKQFSIYALGPDLAARGLDPATLLAGITIVDYEGFVDLAAAHSAALSWF